MILGDVPDTNHGDEPADPHAADREFVRAVRAGSERAWHEFVSRYSGLILAVIQRHLPSDRDDEVRTLFADVLESLYRGKLDRYEGRSALSTWLAIVTRSSVVDHLRRRLGGRNLRRAVKSMDPFDRRLFRLYYIEGLSFGTVLGMVATPANPVTADDLLAALERLDERLHHRLARRLQYDLHAQTVSGSSGRLLEYLDHLRNENEVQGRMQDPEFELLEQEARRTLDAVMAEVARLPFEERQLLNLRFDRGWTARRIAGELGMQGQRAAYTALARVLRVLRRAVGRTNGRAVPPSATGAADAPKAPRSLAEPGELT